MNSADDALILIAPRDDSFSEGVVRLVLDGFGVSGQRVAGALSKWSSRSAYVSVYRALDMTRHYGHVRPAQE